MRVSEYDIENEVQIFQCQYGEEGVKAFSNVQSLAVCLWILYPFSDIGCSSRLKGEGKEIIDETKGVAG